MNGRIIGALVVKDLLLYFRNRFFAVITVLALVFYAAIYFVLPSTVDETITIAAYAPQLPDAMAQMLDAQSVELVTYESAEALREAVENGDEQAGIVLDEATMTALTNGDPAEITIYFAASLPDEAGESISTLLGSSFHTGASVDNVTFDTEIIGRDMVGQQITERDRLIPLFAVFVLLAETLGLASLITEEVEHRTLTALMVTPVSVGGVFVSKGIMGVGLAFTQAAILMAVTGSLSNQPLLLLVALLLGSMLVTGVGFMIASVARDMLSVMGYGVFFMIVLIIPALTVIFPGVVTSWVEIIPTYYLIDTIHQVANFGAGWGDVTNNLLILLVTGVALLGLGVMVLQRRMIR